MKSVISAALALALVGGAAQAQNEQNNDHKKNPPPAPAQRQQAPRQTPPQFQRPTGQPNGAPAGIQRRSATPGVYNGGSGGSGGGSPAYRPQFQRPAGGQPNGAPAGVQPRSSGPGGSSQVYRNRGGAQFNAQRAQRDSGRMQYDPNRWHRSYFAQRRFRGPAFNYPGNWYYQRWAFGQFLPFAWITADYYLDPEDFGLPYPPIDAEWVREGPDAVLVDVTTGQVLSVEYGLFY